MRLLLTLLLFVILICFNRIHSQCYYVFDMQDSYGDGWNGASIEVNINGTHVADFSCNGSATIDSIQSMNGDFVELSFVSGIWDTEITFQIYDPSGTQILSLGPFINNTGNDSILMSGSSNSICIPQYADVTFQVDMNRLSSVFTSPEINGNWNNFCGNCDQMTDLDGDGIWEKTVSLFSGTYEYFFSADSLALQESIDSNSLCSNGNFIQPRRFIHVGSVDMTLPVVCWSSCEACEYWEQQGQDIDANYADYELGYSVSLNAAGNRFVTGAPEFNGERGLVRAFEWDNSAWVQLGQDLLGENHDNFSGRSVSMNAAGDIIAIGAPRNDAIGGFRDGHVRIYTWDGNVWTQLGQDIDGEALGDLSGWSVSMNAPGDRVAIGAPWNDGTAYPEVGHVRIYEWDGSAWLQLGLDIDGVAYNDYFGRSVSMNAVGDRVAIGASDYDVYSIDTGHVRVYEWNGNVWTQLGQDIDGEASGDQSGWSVSMNAVGDRVAIGAPLNDGNGNGSGHARIYEWSGNSWTQLGQDIDGEAFGDQSGVSVSMNAAGDRVAIGAIYNDGNGGSSLVSGHVRIYAWENSSWIQKGQDLDGEASGDLSGWSVSMNAAGDKVAVGAPYNEENGNDAGHVRIHTCAFCTYSTHFITECDNFTWLNGNTYTSSTNMFSNIIPNSQGSDSIISLNLIINYSNSGTDNQLTCDTLTWIDGNTYTSSTNTPTYTLTNAAGCDSVVTLNLTVNTVNSSITNTTPTLTADATGATYQWLDCNNNYAPIAGETNQSFTATANGSYAVEVTQNGCVDTSACEQVNNVGINEINSSITLHPNPTTGIVELQGINGSFKVDVYDYAGKYLQSTSRSTIDLSEYPSGIYFLKVAYGHKTEELRVVKE